LRILIKIH